MKIRLPGVLSYWVARGAIAVVGILPKPLGYALLGGAGRIYFWFARGRQRVALELLRNAYPDLDDRARLRYAREGAVASFKVVLDWVHTTRHIARGDDLRRWVDISVLDSMEQQRGFIALTAHLGSWEMGAAGMALLDCEVHVIGRTLKNPRMQRFLERNRAAVGLHLHPRRGGVRGVARAMREGKIVLMAVDQNQRHRGVFVPFFGRLAATERSAVTLAMRYQTPVVIGHMERLGRGYRFKLHLDPPYRLEGSGSDSDIAAAAADVNRRLERHILSCPEQYLWIHDRYKTRPPPSLSSSAEFPSSGHLSQGAPLESPTGDSAAL